MSETFTSRDARNRVAHIFTDTADGTVLVLDNSVSTGYARRDGRVDFTLTPALATEIRSALDEYISGEESKALLQAREHYEAAKALPEGARVQVSATPLFDSESAHPDAEEIAGKFGIVHHHVETGSRVGSPEAYGVEAGRVVVAMDGTRLGMQHDIHVSSLTVVPAEPAFKVGDVVKVLPTYAAAFWENGHPAHNKHGVISDPLRGHGFTVQVGVHGWYVKPEHLEMVIPA